MPKRVKEAVIVGKFNCGHVLRSINAASVGDELFRSITKWWLVHVEGDGGIPLIRRYTRCDGRLIASKALLSKSFTNDEHTKRYADRRHDNPQPDLTRERVEKAEWQLLIRYQSRPT